MSVSCPDLCMYICYSLCSLYANVVFVCIELVSDYFQDLDQLTVAIGSGHVSFNCHSEAKMRAKMNNCGMPSVRCNRTPYFIGIYVNMKLEKVILNLKVYECPRHRSGSDFSPTCIFRECYLSCKEYV